MNDLSGKVALISGGSRGIGAAIAVELARAGATIALNYRSRREAALEVARGIRERDGTCEVFGADVAKATEVEEMVAAVVRRFERVDILVNNAGVAIRREVGRNDAAAFSAHFDTNVLGPVLLTEAVMRHFPRSGGRVINIASPLAFAPFEGLILYSASKAALVSLTRGFAKALGPRGITVNAVAPGVTTTDMTDDIPQEEREMLAARTPLRRLGQTEDIVGAVAFLASAAASWVTGQTLVIDGGLNER